MPAAEYCRLSLRPRAILMVRMAARVLPVLVLLFVVAPSAPAAKRVALVIGNGAYQKAPELTNPKNDAEDMAAALNARARLRRFEQL